MWWAGERWKRLGWNDEIRGPILIVCEDGSPMVVSPRPAPVLPDSGAST